MKYVSKKDSKVIAEVSIDELRALLDIVTEALEGPYALSVKEWDIVGFHSPEQR